jgi:CTP synthase
VQLPFTMPQKKHATGSASEGQHSRSQTKWVFITGGVVSGLGKGTATASIGKLLSGNFSIVPIKCDGYLNIDPGTMNPFEHGEVFVLDDGGEVDMDFGHYERFLNINCKSSWSITTGKVYDSIIRRERKGDFLGKTVQVIPHVTNEIKKNWKDIASREKADIVTIEIGGTIGDIENSWFVEAARQMRKDVGHNNVLYVHLTYVPYVASVGQQKTKPAQRDVETLRAAGIVPDIIVGRSEKPLTKQSKQKIALFCDVLDEAVISAPDIGTIYEVPLVFEKEGMLDLIAKKFSFTPKRDMVQWRKLIENIKHPEHTINIALCGKYTSLTDAYASLLEALKHAGAHLKTKVNVEFIESSDLENGKKKAAEVLAGKDAIIIPIGFGSRGVEGKIACARYAREHKIPFLGLCYGLQLAVVEFARNVCRIADAHTTEVDELTSNPVVMILPEQVTITEKGATMRLGAQKSELKKGSVVQKLYGTESCEERHRHRFEVNPDYHDVLEQSGMILSGTTRSGKLVEFIELAKDVHPYFVATQAHPEYRSRLEYPSPLFTGLVKAAVQRKK